MKRLLLAFALAGLLYGQPTLPNAVPMPTPEIQYLDINGRPLVGAKLCTYAANSSTPLATYTSSTAGSPNTNPVILDTAGRASIWVGPALYKFVLRTGGTANSCNDGAIQWTQDNVADTTLYFANYVKTVGTCTLITFTTTDTGGVSRTCSQKLADWLSVKDFGAVGNSSTDDTVALQAAIDAAMAGEHVLYQVGSSGCYKATDTLVITGGNITWSGFGDHEGDICYSGDAAKDIIKIGDASSMTYTYRVFLKGFRIHTDTGAASGVKLELTSEGVVDIQISGTSSDRTLLGNGIYCDQCFLYTLAGTVSWATNGIWFNDSVGSAGAALNTVSNGNIFETTAAIKFSWAESIYVQNTMMENFDAAVEFANDCGFTACTIDNVVFTNNMISTNAAATHASPVGARVNLTTVKVLGVKKANFLNNRISVAKQGGGTTPYVFNFDISAVAFSYVLVTQSMNNFEGGTTASMYGTTNVIVADLGGNNYRLVHSGDDRPNSEISAGTMGFTRWDYRQYDVFNPQPAGLTHMTIKATATQFGIDEPVMSVSDTNGDNDIDYAPDFGWIFRTNPSFQWVKKYGYRDADDTVYGFSGFGDISAFNYLFVGSDRLTPWQTWYKTGNTSIGTTPTDDGHLLHVQGTAKLDGVLTTQANIVCNGGYGQTTIPGSSLNIMQLGCGGSGSNAASFAWGDGSGYKINFGPVLTGTFTPKAYITDGGQLGGTYHVSTGIAFASLTTPANGSLVWCTDCVVASTCAGSGSGAWAFRTGGIWKCPF